MNTGSKIAIGVGAAAMIGALAYYALSKSKNTLGKYLLQTTAGLGGAINPNSPSGIYEPAGIVVPVTITANPGYTIGQVLEDYSQINTSTTDTTATYQITMNMNHEIDVVFYPGGNPPPGGPVQIQALSSQILVWGYYGCKVVTAADVIQSVNVGTCDQNWTYGNVAQTKIQFKVIDSNGNGVPGVKVTLYPSLFPDASKYQGYLSLNNQMISQSNPLILTSDSNGIVTVTLSYWYGLTDQYLRICQDAELYLWGVMEVLLPIPIGITVKNIGSYPTIPPVFFWSKGGHGITGQTPAMGGMQANTVIAQIPQTSIPSAQTLCSCGFNIKML